MFIIMKWSKNSRSKASVWSELTCAISSAFLFKCILHSSFEDELNLELLQEGSTSVSQKIQSRIVVYEMQQMCKVRMCKVRQSKLPRNREKYSSSSILPAQAAQIYSLGLVKCISGNSAVLEDWHMEETMPSAIHTVLPHPIFCKILWFTPASERAANQSWLFKHYPLGSVGTLRIYSHVHKTRAWVINPWCSRARLSDKGLGTATWMEKRSGIELLCSCSLQGVSPSQISPKKRERLPQTWGRNT